MGFKKFGLKTGSWLNNVDPKNKSSKSKGSIKEEREDRTIFEDEFLNSEEVINSPTLRELISAESTPNLLSREEGDSMETSSQRCRRMSNVSAPKALLRMFSIGGKKKKDAPPSPSPSTSDLRRTMLNNSTSQLPLSNPRANSYHQPSNTLPRASNVPSMNSTQYFTASAPPSQLSSPAIQHLGEVTTSPHSEGSVRPFTTAAPASAASFTLSPTHSQPISPNNLVDLTTSASYGSGPSSEATELATPRSSQLGSPNSSRANSARMNSPSNHSSAVPGDPSYTLSVSRLVPASLSPSSAENSGVISSCSGVSEIHHEANSLSSLTNSSLSSGMASLINREFSGSTKGNDDTALLRNEIARLTKELAELGEDRDHQVARMGVLRTELGKSEATLKSEQIAGRQELEALLELQAQHQALQRTQREREAAHQELLDEKAVLEKNLAAALAQLQEVSSSSAEASDLVMERNQLRGWLDEEKDRHNEVRGELAQAKTQLRNNEARIAHLESINQEQAETIHKLELRDTDANEGALREINYYQDQLNDALRSRDELRDELDRSKEQIRVLRVSMEQLLKAGVADGESPKPPSFSTRGTHSKTASVVDSSSFNFNRDSDISGNSRSVCSDDLESMSSSDFMAQASAAGSARYGLGNDRRRTFGLDHTSTETSQTHTQAIQEASDQLITPLHHSPEQTSKSSIFPGSSTPTDTSSYWDQRLRELLKEKDRINLEYGRIPTSKITISVRRRKENLEQALDQLDAEISGARSKIRALVI